MGRGRGHRAAGPAEDSNLGGRQREAPQGCLPHARFPHLRYLSASGRCFGTPGGGSGDGWGHGIMVPRWTTSRAGWGHRSPWDLVPDAATTSCPTLSRWPCLHHVTFTPYTRVLTLERRQASSCFTRPALGGAWQLSLKHRTAGLGSGRCLRTVRSSPAPGSRLSSASAGECLPLPHPIPPPLQGTLSLALS